MSQSFYKYIVKELIIGYFKKNPLKKGSRYYLIIENEEYRNRLMEAIEEESENITISGIYQGGVYSVQEEAYETHVIHIAQDTPALIVGYDKTSTEDYLTTIRNSVGVAGSKYENYGVLYILSDSILSSIVTACQDLQAQGGPLCARYIIKDIQEQAENKITKDLEKAYLTSHLNMISEYIADGTCTLFDFRHALSVLSEGTQKNHYNDLGFFSDKRVYDGTFKPTDSEIRKRVELNHMLFQRVSDAMSEDDLGEKTTQLEKFLDERLAKKLAKSDAWLQVDVQELITSKDIHDTTAKLELLSVELPSQGLLTHAEYWTSGNKKKKSVTYMVICDQTSAEAQQVKITFNKNIKAPSSSNYQANGQTLKVNVGDRLEKFSIGINDNHHDFYFLKLPCPSSFFKDIRESFFIDRNGEIVVEVPAELNLLTFGEGENVQNIPFDGKVDWEDDTRIEVPVSPIEESEEIDFEVNFGGVKLGVILKMFASKPVPPARPGMVFGKYIGGQVVVDGKVRPIVSYWKTYLDWEQAFVMQGCAYINNVFNDISNEYEAVYEMLELPSKVQTCLSRLFEYFKTHETVPSLCRMSEELRILYTAYWEAIIEVVQGISNRCMTREEYGLTKLGMVSNWDKSYLSPFHPILVAYTLEYDAQFDNKEYSAFAKKLLKPFYLMPYIFVNNKALRPYSDLKLTEITNWLSYEGVCSAPQERINDITTKMVWSKMSDFIRHFRYLFQDKDCPIIISTVGIHDDTNVIKGVLEFIRREYATSVQRIELHEYVDNLMDETFFEKLNRLDSIDSITRELEAIGVKMEIKGEYTSQEMIHQLFTRVTFYKHAIDDAHQQISYCHIAFYQMDTGNAFIRQATNELRTELSFNGLISVPSTANKSGAYIIGYGTGGQKVKDGFLFPMVTVLNSLYANEQQEGSGLFSKEACVAKRFKFSKSVLLDSIYDNANWVTFINPEVDINFFYKQNVYVVHYTDQYTINAKYDSITVTRHVDQYVNMLRRSYEKYALSEERFVQFNTTMVNYFNCLNGSWMLSIVNKSEEQIREKMSIVAACIAMLRFMRRNQNVLWIPVSLDEILRVTGSIGLPKEYIFTKKTLGIKGAMLDDLLMMGLDTTDADNLKLYLYPVEVKFSKNTSMASKAGKQVSQTFLQLKEHLFGEANFTKNIYRTFFASQFLNNAEKLNANALLGDQEYQEIEKYRSELLNLKYTLQEKLPVKEMGKAAILSFFSHASHSLATSLVDNVPICEIHFSEQECFQSVAEPESQHLDFLSSGVIQIDKVTLDAMDTPLSVPDHADEEAVIVQPIGSDDSCESQFEPKAVPKTVPSVTPVLPSSDVLPVKSNRIKIKVGHTLSGHREIIFEPNNTKMVSHPNMGVIGTMGTGKTQFARSVIAQLAKEGANNLGGHPVGMLVFDYKGDYKDKEFLDAVGGTCYKFNYPFNPLKLVVNDEVDGMNLPAITADRIADSFAKAYGLGLKQQSNIKQVILETYADAGITKNPQTWSNSVPTMEQVIDKYFETYDANDKAYALFDKLRDYTIFTTDNSVCVSLFEWLNSVRVIDLTLYPDDTKKVIVSLFLDLFYAEMRQLGGSQQKNGFRELRAMIMVDEAHQFLKKDFNSFRSIISEGRMFGVGMILSTQNVSDFKTSKEDYSQFILSWVIHHVNSISKTEIASIFGAADQNADRYMDFINKAKLFESVCKIGPKVDGIRDLPFFELIDEDDRFKKEE